MSDLPFTLDQLRILKAIAAEGSFKRAADSLYVSQPAVSLQVQNLERSLAVPLFDRGGRRAQLTEAGHLLLEYGDRILSLCQETCRAIEDLQNLQGGTLIIGASQTTGTYMLPRMIGQFRQRYPEVAVQLHVHSTRRTAWAVANGQIDLAIIGGEIPPELQESLEAVAYAEDELALVMPVFHPLATNDVIARSDLYKLKFITLDSQSTTRKAIDQVLTKGGIETRRLRIEMELNSIEAIKNAVQSGLGVAFLSTSAIEKELQMGVIHRARIESVEVKRTLSVIFNPNRYRSKAAEAFTREILPQFTNRDLAFFKDSASSKTAKTGPKSMNAKAVATAAAAATEGKVSANGSANGTSSHSPLHSTNGSATGSAASSATSKEAAKAAPTQIPNPAKAVVDTDASL